MEKIIIRQEYFDNIKVAVDSINKFFESQFEVKDFPVDRSNLEYSISWIIDILNDLDPVYIKDQNTIDEAIDGIVEKIEATPNDIEAVKHDRAVENATDSIIAYAALQIIAENFELFQTLINGIYTFDIFLHPSKYTEALDLFTQNVNLPSELEELGIDVPIFSIQEYVGNLMMGCALVTFPESMDVETQTSRMLEYQDLEGYEVNISKNTQPIQEAATEVSTPKASHIRYDKKEKKFVISQQLDKFVKEIVEGIRKCENVKELKEFMLNSPTPNNLLGNICPYLLAQVYDDEDLYSGKVNKDALKKYTEVYLKKYEDAGGKRFKNYDIFTTFKADKEGTIKFIEDFLTLKLVNDTQAGITNNMILAIFNIFDSRLYLDTLFNVLPFEEKKETNEDDFVKKTRARINHNSRRTAPYQPDFKAADEEPTTSSEVQEYVLNQLEAFGDMTIEEMQICNQYNTMLMEEISTLDDAVYNNRMSPGAIDLVMQEAFMPYKKSGAIPDYMKSRIRLHDSEESDEDTEKVPEKKPQKEEEPVKEPDTIEIPDPEYPAPDNSVDDLADSVEAKMDTKGELDDCIGRGFEENPYKKQATTSIVYNITNTYNHSFNSTNDSHNTNNDFSVGKVESRNIQTSEKPKSGKNKRSNNISNNSASSDTKESKGVADGQKLSNGMTVQEMLTFLESEEPLSDGNAVKKGARSESLTDSIKESKKQREDKRAEKLAKRDATKEQGGILTRTKNKLKDVVNSLIQRDEDQVKTEIIESPGYRSSLFKAGRLAVKLGLTGIAFTISGWLGAACIGVLALRHHDRTRLRREVTEELMTEIKILDEKIERAKHELAYGGDSSSPENVKKRKELYQNMRLRSRMVGIVSDVQTKRYMNPEVYEHSKRSYF